MTDHPPRPAAPTDAATGGLARKPGDRLVSQMNTLIAAWRAKAAQLEKRAERMYYPEAYQAAAEQLEWCADALEKIADPGRPVPHHGSGPDNV